MGQICPLLWTKEVDDYIETKTKCPNCSIKQDIIFSNFAVPNLSLKPLQIKIYWKEDFFNKNCTWKATAKGTTSAPERVKGEGPLVPEEGCGSGEAPLELVRVGAAPEGGGGDSLILKYKIKLIFIFTSKPKKIYFLCQIKSYFSHRKLMWHKKVNTAVIKLLNALPYSNWSKLLHSFL